MNLGNSIHHRTLVGGHHVLDVDERVRSAAALHQLQRLLNVIAHTAVGIRDLVANVLVDRAKHVEHGQNLAVIGDERAADVGSYMCELYI